MAAIAIFRRLIRMKVNSQLTEKGFARCSVIFHCDNTCQVWLCELQPATHICDGRQGDTGTYYLCAHKHTHTHNTHAIHMFVTRVSTPCVVHTLARMQLIRSRCKPMHDVYMYIYSSLPLCAPFTYEKHTQTSFSHPSHNQNTRNPVPSHHSTLNFFHLQTCARQFSRYNQSTQIFFLIRCPVFEHKKIEFYIFLSNCVIEDYFFVFCSTSPAEFNTKKNI